MPLPWTDWTCCGCGKTNENAVEHGGAFVQERSSLGVYAGHWCQPCWERSGYRQEGPEGFDPMDAGESYEPVE